MIFTNGVAASVARYLRGVETLLYYKRAIRIPSGQVPNKYTGLLDSMKMGRGLPNRYHLHPPLDDIDLSTLVHSPTTNIPSPFYMTGTVSPHNIHYFFLRQRMEGSSLGKLFYCD